MSAGGRGGSVGGVLMVVWHDVPGEATGVRQAEGVHHKCLDAASPLRVRQPGCGGRS